MKEGRKEDKKNSTQGKEKMEKIRIKKTECRRRENRKRMEKEDKRKISG